LCGKDEQYVVLLSRTRLVLYARTYGAGGWVEHHIQSFVNEKDNLAAKRGFSACSSLS